MYLLVAPPAPGRLEIGQDQIVAIANKQVNAGQQVGHAGDQLTGQLLLDADDRTRWVGQLAGLEGRQHAAIEVADKPGGLMELLGLFARAGLNVTHMYAFTERLGQSAVLVFSFDDLDAAITCLTRAGINPVTPVFLYDRAGGQ